MVDAAECFDLLLELLNAPLVFHFSILEYLDDNPLGHHFFVGGEIHATKSATAKLTNDQITAIEQGSGRESLALRHFDCLVAAELIYRIVRHAIRGNNLAWVSSGYSIGSCRVELRALDYCNSQSSYNVLVAVHCLKVLNPTHGSGWIGSGLFYRHILNCLVIPPTAVGGLVQV